MNTEIERQREGYMKSATSEDKNTVHNVERSKVERGELREKLEVRGVRGPNLG